jgi:hypothetical protein
MVAKKKTPEGQLKASIRQLLNTVGIFHFNVLQGLGCYPGISDILGVYRGTFLAIEIKAPRGHASPLQIEFLKRVKEEGGIAILAYSVDDVIRGLGIEDRFLNFK